MRFHKKTAKINLLRKNIGTKDTKKRVKIIQVVTCWQEGIYVSCGLSRNRMIKK